MHCSRSTQLQPPQGMAGSVHEALKAIYAPLRTHDHTLKRKPGHAGNIVAAACGWMCMIPPAACQKAYQACLVAGKERVTDPPESAGRAFSGTWQGSTPAAMGYLGARRQRS